MPSWTLAHTSGEKVKNDVKAPSLKGEKVRAVEAEGDRDVARHVAELGGGLSII